MWDREQNWPQDIPKPHQSFLIFLESAAIREASGSKGEFIGSVLKALTTARTFVDTQESTLRMLVDSGFINEYLYSSSSFPIDRAVESFHSAVVTLLSTPTGEKDAVLGMPGIGYTDAFPAIRAEKEAWVAEASNALAQDEGVLTQARASVEAAQGAPEQAQKRFNNAATIIKTAEKQGSVKLSGDVIVTKGDPRLKAALEKHRQEVQSAKDELGTATSYLEKAVLTKAKHEKDLLWRRREFEKFLATETPEAVAKELSRHFRDLLEQYKGNGGTLDASGGKPLSCFDDVANRMAERLPNPTITMLLSSALELVDEMMDVRVHFDPDRVQERKLLRSLDDGRREQLALLAKDGNTEAAGILLREIKAEVSEERDDSETFEFKKRAFDRKVAELGAAIEAASLPEDLKERLRALHGCLASLRYGPDDIAEQAGRIRKQYARPLGKAVTHAVRKLEDNSFRNLVGISEAEKILARMTFEARSGDLPAQPGKSESGWKRFYQKVRYHLFTTESWVSRDKNRPGKLVWLYRKTIAEDLSDLLGENSPDTAQAGLHPDALNGSAWTMNNSTVRDSDKDGNPEWKYELRIAAGMVNRTLLNGTLTYIVGFEYEYRDADSDGEPEFEKATSVKYANFSVSGTTLAEGIEFSEAIRNDTDGDGTVDRVEVRHLSFGYHATFLGTIKSFAVAGELIMTDGDANGVFENKEATAAFFFKHEKTNPSVTLKEALVIVHGKETPSKAEVSKLAFQRINNTQGVTLLEEGYVWTYSEMDGYKELVALAGRNNSVTGRVQYAVLNASEKVVGTQKQTHVTAFAVENSTLLFGGIRSDAVAIDVTVIEDGSTRAEKGFLAAARTDVRPSRKDESFVLISVERESVSNVTTSEEVLILAGHNATASGLNSTMALATRSYTDADGDGNAEYLRTSWAVGRSEDWDMDGTVEAEAYIVHWDEIKDQNDDGNPEWNQSFTMMGWKSNPDDDDDVDVERGLMTNVTAYDTNSNGYVELKETGMVGFQKTDSDSDGNIDKEEYIGAWEKVTDVNDDGTEINTQSGTWAHEA